MKKTGIIFALFCFSVFHISAQNINVENLKGENVNFAEIIKSDAPVIVTFWATWCKPCLMEMEALKELKDEWNGKVRVVAISIDDSRSKNKVASLVKGKDFPFEIYLDSNQALYKSMNLTSVPFAFVFVNGKQVYKHNGYSPGDEDYLIEEALKHVK